MAAKRGLCAAPEAAGSLQAACSDFLAKHTACYGDTHVKPKHHWAQDLGAQLARDATVLDAFVIERQHLMVKRICEYVENTSQYEVPSRVWLPAGLTSESTAATPD